MTLGAEHIAIRMTDKERLVFERLISKSSAYLEYGCGGSTEIAAGLSRGIIVSIESDPGWVSLMKEKDVIAAAINKGRLFMHHIDLGPVGDWGAPKDKSKIENWPQYYMAPFTRHDFLYDLVLIDGRFRNACAYAAYALSAEDTIIIIHDYTVRNSYHDIEKFYNIIEVADTLVVLEKKRHILQRSLYTSIFESVFRF